MKKELLIEACLRIVQAYSTKEEWKLYEEKLKTRLNTLSVYSLEEALGMWSPFGIYTLGKGGGGDFESNLIKRYNQDSEILTQIKDKYRKLLKEIKP